MLALCRQPGYRILCLMVVHFGNHRLTIVCAAGPMIIGAACGWDMALVLDMLNLINEYLKYA